MLNTNISQFHSHYNPTQIPGERKNEKMKNEKENKRFSNNQKHI